MLILPGLDGPLMQHPPYGTATDLLVQRRLRPAHQIGKRLPAQGLFGFGDHFTRHRMDQRLIQRGKKWVCAHAQADRLWKNRRWPSGFANVAPAGAKGQRPRRPPCSAGWAAHEGATPGDSAERSEPRQYVVERCRVEIHVECILQKLVREGTTSGHWTWHSGFLSLPGFLGIHLLIPKVYANRDVICETDH